MIKYKLRTSYRTDSKVTPLNLYYIFTIIRSPILYIFFILNYHYFFNDKTMSFLED